MGRQTAIENLLDLYENPTHRGPLEGADVSVNGGNPGCGDVVTIHLLVGGGDTASRIMFEGEGCTISQAAAELVTSRMEGATLHDIEELQHDIIIDELGREVVMSRPRCATLALGTLKQAVQEYRDTKRKIQAAADTLLSAHDATGHQSV
ncbi:MAG TPA: iron-sulfur cluster assembly scaffold protein [Chloroflexia bacterium]|nr:iron-sulfur cluster assembly scaffold protein [Chloroflexia bacterium]